MFIEEAQRGWNAWNAPHKNYHLAARLRGHTGPINCLRFTRDGVLLASGGDDESVRIWAIATTTCQQVIQDRHGRWGQITCITWMPDTGNQNKTLCFGTGRGLIVTYRKLRTGALYVECSSTRVVPSSDGIEAMVHDPIHNRLAITSHYGEILMHTLEKNGTLVELWKKRVDDVIPRAIHFLEGFQDIVIFCLETGEMTLQSAEEAEPVGKAKTVKFLKSEIGSAIVCPKGKYVLIDNLSSGFDLYNIPRTSPTYTMSIRTQKRFVKQGAFLENCAGVACGSDHGKIYIYCIETGERLQILQHATDKILVQTVDSVTTPEAHIIASGSSADVADICLWKKKIPNERKTSKMETNCKILIDVVIVLLLTWLSSIWLSSDYLTGAWVNGKSALVRASWGVQDEPRGQTAWVRGVDEGHYDESHDYL